MNSKWLNWSAPGLWLVAAMVLTSCNHNDAAQVDAVSSATHIQAGSELPPPNEAYRVFKRDGLKNYIAEYDERFYRGGEIIVEDLALEALEELGIKTVISVTPDDEERAFCAANGLELIELPFSKKGPAPEDYQKFFEALENKSAPYYVHCKGGSHRAGILGAAYRMRMLGWTFESAIIEYGRLGGDLKGDHVMIESLRLGSEI